MSSNPRKPSDPILVWNSKPAGPRVQGQSIYGDRFDSLPVTSKVVRRNRGEKITAEPAPTNQQKPGSSKSSPYVPSTPDIKQLWLDSEPNWKTRLGPSWKGWKILGAGSFGIAGLWSLDDLGANDDQAIRNVVVKQTGTRQDDVRALREEAEISQLFKDVQTKHIVRMYGKYMVELSGGQVDPIGTGTGSNLARIYIEYCEDGDMRRFMKILKSKFTARNPIPEELIWEIFKCLVLGLVVMEHGNEQLSGPTWNSEIAHMDIKPENILIANNDNEHLKMPIVKMADFGVSRIVPNPQSIEWMHKQFHTPHYRAPESFEVDKKYSQIASYESDDEDETVDPKLRYGSHTNIWGVGKVMYNIINRGHSFANNTPIYWFQPVQTQRPIRTQGPAIKNAPYSPDLRKTVMHCLAVDWRERPKSRDLLKRVNDKLAAIASPAAPAYVKAGPGVGFGAGFDAGLTLYPEPTDPFPAL